MGSYPPSAASPVAAEGNRAVVAHIGSFVSAWFALGLAAPLIVLLTRGGDSPFIRRHASSR